MGCWPRIGVIDTVRQVRMGEGDVERRRETRQSKRVDDERNTFKPSLGFMAKFRL